MTKMTKVGRNRKFNIKVFTYRLTKWLREYKLESIIRDFRKLNLKYGRYYIIKQKYRSGGKRFAIFTKGTAKPTPKTPTRIHPFFESLFSKARMLHSIHKR